jgi:hypothetical protein
MSYGKMELGTAPAYEDCAQVGTPGYPEESREECKRYIAQLNSMFHPLIVQLDVQGWFRYELDGDSREVIFKYNEDNELNGLFSIFIENHMPRNWSDAPHVYTKEEFEAWRNEP